MANIKSRFFEGSLRVEPLSIGVAEAILRRVSALESSLWKVIQVRGDTDGKTVKGDKILQGLESTLRQILSSAPQDTSSSAIENSASFDATSMPGKR